VLFKYIAETGCFHNTFGDLPEIVEEGRNKSAGR